MFISKKLFLPESKRGGGGGVKNVRRSNLFQGDGAQLLFFYRTCCFPGGSGLPVPPLDSRIAYVHVSLFLAF